MIDRNSVVSINERAVSIALKAPSNLVESWYPTPDKISLAQHLVSMPASTPNQRCFPQVNRKINCFDGDWTTSLDGDINEPLSRRSGKGGEAFSLGNRLYVPVRLQPCPVAFKAVCGTQTRMPEGFNLMCNQTQALSTPDNLVGGTQYVRTIPATSRA